MSADRETRVRLEEVQQRLAGIEDELALEETPGFADEMRELERQLELTRGRAQRSEQRLAEANREHDDAAHVVKSLELRAQARQSNHIDDLLGGVGALAMVIVIAAVAIIFTNKKDVPLELVASAGVLCAGALGSVLRARVVRPKSNALKR